jgi:hypothetical protein
MSRQVTAHRGIIGRPELKRECQDRDCSCKGAVRTTPHAETVVYALLEYQQPLTLLLCDFTLLSTTFSIKFCPELNMSQQLEQNTQEILGMVKLPDQTDPYIPAFMKACVSNEITVALDLAPGREANSLTFGLNHALRKGHIELASRLLELGAKLDFNTIRNATESFEGIKLVCEAGYDVNTPLLGGGTLLGYVLNLILS